MKSEKDGAGKPADTGEGLEPILGLGVAENPYISSSFIDQNILVCRFRITLKFIKTIINVI